MKSTIQKLLLLILITGGSSFISTTVSAQDQSYNYQVFYDELSPYGNWIHSQAYGYVWVPNVAQGFTPYGTNGYWAYTEDGWTWISNYAWGWAPFHYGRWYFDDFYGPIWVPGYEWGPGWVIWRQYNGYYGWAPIGPGISYHDAYGSGYHVPHHHWHFIHEKDFGRNGQEHHYVNRANNQGLLNKSTIINRTQTNVVRNTIYYAGPDRKRVEVASGQSVSVMKIQDNSKPGERINNDKIEIYRPNVNQDTRVDQQAAPRNVKKLSDLKKQASAPVKEREPVVNPGTPINQRSDDPASDQKNEPRQFPSQPERNNTPPTSPREENRNEERPTPQKVRTEPAQQVPQHTAPPQQRTNTPRQNSPAPTQHNPSNQSPPSKSQVPKQAPKSSGNRGQRRTN